MKKIYYKGVWITLIFTIASIGIYFVTSYSLNITLISSIAALIAGFQSLKILHQHPKYFKGEAIVIACIIIASIGLLINLVIHGLYYLLPIYLGE